MLVDQTEQEESKEKNLCFDFSIIYLKYSHLEKGGEN